MVIPRFQIIVSKGNRRSYVRMLKSKHINNYNERANSPEVIFQIMEEAFELSSMAEEHIYVICLNTKYNIIGVSEVSHGTVNASILSPREIYLRALLMGATSIVLVHNHPSQDPTPSNDDFNATKRIKEVGNLVNVKLMDHIIIGESYYSLKEHGEL